MAVSFDLSNHTALVTGATGGIGASIARTLHGAGANLVISGTRQAALGSLLEELGERAVAIPCNLSDADDVNTLIKSAEEASGPVDILINNAGMTKDGLAMRMNDDDWESVLAVDLSAAFRLSRAALRPMLKARWGRIINITSVVGHTGNPGQANYAAAKAGLGGMTRSLAAETAARGVTVNCVAPGFIQTAMTDALNEKQKAAILERIPAGKMGTPEDVAAAVLYLASDAGGYITGQSIHVNGGMAMV
ncbi:MAG: 3-oxoacyl-[acyl-carrier-protein] reductase [Alphaproteobacteria bacterium]